MPKVSVIIPVFNAGKFLERCLKSVFGQTLNDIEIICINDGSTDNSEQILNNFSQDKRLRIFSQKNSGLSASRNIGINIATGDFIAFIDSDDFIDKSFLEKLYLSAINNNADIACAGIIRENEKKHSELIKYDTEICTEDIKSKFEFAGIPKYNFVWNKIYNREKLKSNNIKFVDGMIYEDMCFTPLVMEKLERMVCVPDIFYHYWKHPNSLIKIDSDKSRADKILGHRFLSEKCKKYNINQNKNEIISQKEHYLLGIKLLRTLEYRATIVCFLFGFIPVYKVRKFI